jgi:Protein of unknwon function (DUF3310)
MTANEKQVAGTHYKADVEHWDFVVANDLNYFEGQITKYVARCRKKNGVQDLEKAMHFLEKYLEVFKVVRGHPTVVKQGYYGEKGPPPSPAHFVAPDIGNEYEKVPVALYAAAVPDPATHFTVEGYHGSGANVYACKVCRAEVHAANALDAVVQHGVPCTRPRPARAG